jgi:phospholipid-binding lipoprotein MlaA
VRDAIGLGADLALNPLNYLSYPDKTAVSISQQVVGGLDVRERTQADEDNLLADAADPYATLRSVYLQNREAMIRGETAVPPLPPLDEPTAPPSSPTAEPPATAPPSASLDRPLLRAADDVADPDAPIATARDYAPQVAAASAPVPAA